MSVARASGAILGLVALCASVSCVAVDQEPDIAEASHRFIAASGIETHWASDAPLEPLRPPADGIVPQEQVLDVALRNNRMLRADLETIGQAKADFVQAGLFPNPMLSFWIAPPSGGGRTRFDFGFSQDLAALWLIPTRKQATQAALQQRILSFADSAVAFIAEVRANYYNYQFQALAIELQEQNAKLLKDILEVNQARLKAGEASQVDVYFTRGRLLETQIALLELHADQQVTRQTLLRLMGVAESNENWSATPIEERLSVISASESEIVDAALRQRLDVQAARWAVDSALAEFQQQRLRLIPTLGVGFLAEQNETRGIPGRRILADTARASIAAGQLTAPQIESRAQRQTERNLIIDMVLGPTIEVPLPIFDQNQAQVAKAQARARELLQRQQETEQRVMEGVRSALTRRRLAEDRVRLYEDSLIPQWEANLNVARQAFQAGRESIVTVLLAQQTLIAAQLGYASSLRDLSTSTAALERELSGPIPGLQTNQPVTQPTASTQPVAGHTTTSVGESIGAIPAETTGKETK